MTEREREREEGEGRGERGEGRDCSANRQGGFFRVDGLIESKALTFHPQAVAMDGRQAGSLPALVGQWLDETHSAEETDEQTRNSNLDGGKNIAEDIGLRLVGWKVDHGGGGGGGKQMQKHNDRPWTAAV
jgi:hypothetical protein